MRFISIALMICAAMCSVASVSPEDVFRTTPHRAKTGVWWHWMGSCISKEGIVADLDWFVETGIGSATIFGIADICTPWATHIGDIPGKKIIAFTPEWWKIVRFACDEAEKRNIELGIHNCPGYTSTGGPWIPSELAMRQLVFNVTNAETQISLRAKVPFPIEVSDGKFGKPDLQCRRTDVKEIGVVDGVRIAHIPMGSYTQPNQIEAFGLECDKMNPEAVAFHLDHVIGDMKKYLGHHVGNTMKFVLLDSYEAGTPSWTPRMREEFIARRGYDPLPYLPILGGFKVKAAPDKAAEAKFREDFNRTMKDLYRDVLYKIMHEKLAAAGLEFACEPYTGPFDSQECAQHVDRVMMEFWYKGKPKKFNVPKKFGWNQWIGPVGKRHNVIEAEAFTSGPPYCNWDETPFHLKTAADIQFARGANRMTLHTCPLQPWGDDVKPGKVMGRWGTHFGRTQTWSKSGKGFFTYLNRCQALLQWGAPGKARVRGINIKPVRTPFSSLCREADGVCLFFVANHSDHEAALDLVLPTGSGSARIFNAVDGTISPTEIKDGKIHVPFPAFGSCFVEVRKTPQTAKFAKPMRTVGSVDFSKGWNVSFDGFKVDMPELKDWTSFTDSHVKYFSGTAEYTRKMKCSKHEAEKGAVLDLGNCNAQIARVIVNGRDCGTIWCEPYEAKIPSGILREGENELKIEFTNVWANRLIGDEQEAPDCEFAKAPYPGGWYLKRFPKWFKDGIKARPSKGRKCFTDWNYFTKDSPLIPSGLLGPVVLKLQCD